MTKSSATHQTDSHLSLHRLMDRTDRDTQLVKTVSEGSRNGEVIYWCSKKLGTDLFPEIDKKYHQY